MAEKEQGGFAPPSDSEGVVGDGNLSVEDIQGMFTEAADVSEPGESSETDTGEETGEDSELAGLGEEGGESGEPDDSENPPDDPDDDVLSDLKPKAAEKARKRIDTLTKRAKTAEEQLEAQRYEFDRQIEELRATRAAESRKVTQQSLSLRDKIESAETPEELSGFIEEAKTLKRFARENQTKDYVELGDRELTGENVRALLNEVEDILEETVPRRFNYIRSRHQSEQLAQQQFPAWGDRQHPDHALLTGIWDTTEVGKVLKKVPQGRYAAGVMAIGIRALEAMEQQRQAQQQGGKQAQTQAAPRKATAVAQRVPGMDSASPAPTGKSERRIPKAGAISLDELSAFLADA